MRDLLAARGVPSGKADTVGELIRCWHVRHRLVIENGTRLDWGGASLDMADVPALILALLSADSPEAALDALRKAGR